MTDRLRRWVLHGVADDAPGVSGDEIDAPEEVLVVELDPDRTIAVIADAIRAWEAKHGHVAPAWQAALAAYRALDPYEARDD